MNSKHKIPRFGDNFEKENWYCGEAGPRTRSEVKAVIRKAMKEFKSYSSLDRREKGKLYAERKPKYQLHYDRIVYTDGSVSSRGNGGFGVYEGCGFGVFEGRGSEQSVTGPIPFDQTSLNAELFAVYMALLYDSNVADAMRIESDCFGVVQALNSYIFSSNCRYPDLCSKILHVMAARPGPIGIGYVPGHTGIFGNERADRLAGFAGHQNFSSLPGMI